MSFNPFKRRQKQHAGGSGNADASSPSTSRPGIMIGMQQHRGGAKHGIGYPQTEPPAQQQSPDGGVPSLTLDLPPESNYRTSLIMPHLTRRFTLLRAPDGSVVTPDTMRAHLRAQRARARAAGQPGVGGQQHFLTEQEEDEIIEQMRAQARSEGNRYAQQHTESMFGGTDGFGGGLSATSSRFDPTSIHSSTSNTTQHTSLSAASSSADRMGSLAESLGDLRTISTSSSSGSLFSGRSSERDNAYLRGLKKSTSRVGVDPSAAPIAEETEEEDEATTSSHPYQQPSVPGETAETDDDETGDMPGGFGGTSRRASAIVPGQQVSQSAQEPQQTDKDDDDDEDARPLPQFIAKQPRKSQLLSTLSPEAFNRVSLALEEVIGSLSPGIAPDEADDYEFEAGSTETDGEGDEADDHHGRDDSGDVPDSSRDMSTYQSSSRHGDDLGGSAPEHTPLTSIDDAAADDADDEADEEPVSPLTRLAQVPKPTTPASVSRSIRRGDGAVSPESDALSFQSAREDAPQGNLPLLGDAGLPSELSQSTIRPTPVEEASEGEQTRSASLLADDKTPRIPQQASPVISQKPYEGPTSPSVAASPYLAHLGQHKRGGSSSSEGTNPAGHANSSSSSSPNLRPGRPLSPDVSNHEAPLLSANAIAARNQQRFYFPANISSGLTNGLTSQRTPDSYASGFRQSPAPTGRPGAGPGGASSHQALAAATRGAEASTGVASRPSEDVPDSRGLFPRPPQQGKPSSSPTLQVQQAGGRGTTSRLTGNSSTDSALSDAAISEFERQFEQDTEADDVWATVARNLQSNDEGGYQEALDSVAHPYSRSNNANGPAASGLLPASGGVQDIRPTSHVPPAEAATQFEDAGFSMDQLAEIQASLVRSASTAQHGPNEGTQQSLPVQEAPRPSLPSRPSASSLSREAANDYSNSNGSAPASPRTAASKLEKARERARMIAERARSPTNGMGPLSPAASWDGNRPPSALNSPTSPHGRHGTSNSIDEAMAGSPGHSAGMTKSSSIRSFRSQVMYDVTTSHRPTSPPPRNVSSMASGAGVLPSLHDITLQQTQGGYQPIPPVAIESHRNSTSLSRAVDDTADRYDHNGQSDDGNGPFAGNANGNGDYGGLFNAVGYPEAIPEEAREAIISYDEYDADASAPFSPDQSYAQRTQSSSWVHPGSNNAGDDSMLSVDQARAGHCSSVHASPASVQSGWSSRSGRRNIVDDVAAQARAATQALKGPHSGDGGPHVRPKKSKTLGRKKSKKNPGKVISTPQLVSTSQHMDHAQPIPNPDQSLRQTVGKGKARKPIPIRNATDYKNDPKIGPVTLLERRASSSFGHEGQLPQSPYMPTGARELGADAQTSPSRVGNHAQFRSPSSGPNSASRGPWDTNRDTTHSSSPRSGGQPSPRPGATSPNRQQSNAGQSKTLGRIMSRMRMRKPSEGAASQATIDPYQYPSSPAGTGSQHLEGYTSSPADRSASLAPSSSPTRTRSHTPRGPSPFGLAAGLNAQPERTLPESGASQLAGMFHSPGAEYPPQMSPVVNGDREGHDAAASPATEGAPAGVGLGLGSQALTRSTSHLSPQLGHSNDTVRPPSSMKGGADQSPKLGSPAAIQESRFDDTGADADTSTQTIRQSPVKELAPPLPTSALSPRSSAAEKLNERGAEAGRDERSNQGPASAPVTGTDADKRKSLRDTIVRRTLIFPSDASVLEERRRSLASVSSRRKSRRHADVDDEANASYAALMAGGAHATDASPRGSQDGSRHASPVKATAGEAAGGFNTLATPSMRQSRYGGRTASLRPPSPDGYSRRASGAQSSYAGSLYDMYIGDDGESVYDAGVSGDDPRASFAPAGLSGRNHIEVTERADGSVIWQVVAGLGGRQSGSRHRNGVSGEGRMSTFTGYSGGHSRGNSDASQLSFTHRDSTELSPSYDQQQQPSQERTFTGLMKDEDARSLFAKRRHTQQQQQREGVPDLPLQPFDPKQLQQLQQQRLNGEEQDASRPSSIGGARPSMSLFRPSMEQQTSQLQQQQQQLAFDMATPNAGVTRVVYSNDVELEQLLESLAKQTDEAKFHFDPRNAMSTSVSDGALAMQQPVTRSSLIYRPMSLAAGGSGDVDPRGGSVTSPSSASSQQGDQRTSSASPSYDANRRRVEDEIMSLLNAVHDRER